MKKRHSLEKLFLVSQMEFGERFFIDNIPSVVSRQDKKNDHFESFDLIGSKQKFVSFVIGMTRSLAGQNSRFFLILSTYYIR